MDKKIIIKISNTLTEFLKSHPQYINYHPMRFNTWVGFPSGFNEDWLKYLKENNEINIKKKNKGGC